MENFGSAFRSWLATQTVCGLPVERLDENHWCVNPGQIKASVTFLDTSHAPEIVELRAAREDAHEPCFYTRFVLEDTLRAHRLFIEMSRFVEAEVRRGPTRVLLCCAADEYDTAREFARNLTESAWSLSIPYLFDVASLDKALNKADDYAALMLTPQVAPHAMQMRAKHRDTVIFAVPLLVYKTNQASMAIRLLLEALYEVDTPSCYSECKQSARSFPGQGKVLIANVTYCDRCVRMGYRVYEGDKVRSRGVITKGRLELDDIRDFLASLWLTGISVEELDVIGFITPGVVNFCSMNLPSTGCRDYDLAEKISKYYGIPVFMDNNTNAAAMGCYLQQTEHENLTLYRHQLGHKNGGQGTIVNGQLVTGHNNLAGEPKFYQRLFCYEGGYAASVWSAKGLSVITRNVLLASIGTVSPEVAYIAVSTVEDMDAIRQDLERTLPRYCIPELVTVSDYRDRMYLGEAALCLSRISKL